MARNKSTTENTNRLLEKQRSTGNAEAEVADSGVIKEGFLILDSNSEPREADNEYSEEHSGAALSESEWQIINVLLDKKGKTFQIDRLCKQFGRQISDEISRLISEGIVVQHEDGGYRITSETELMIPLSAEERSNLSDAEARIEELASEIDNKKLEMAAELRIIRDGKLYRETHSSFGDYVQDRFERTRDWAYKAIRDLEVSEALRKGDLDAGVDALIQTVTAREIPHLSRLKGDPSRMRKALREADSTASSEERSRTPDDIKAAVEAVIAPDNQVPAEPKPTRLVEFIGIEYGDCETDDLPKLMAEFAKWLRKNPTSKAFAINVGELA